MYAPVRYPTHAGDSNPSKFYSKCNVSLPLWIVPSLVYRIAIHVHGLMDWFNNSNILLRMFRTSTLIRISLRKGHFISLSFLIFMIFIFLSCLFLQLEFPAICWIHIQVIFGWLSLSQHSFYLSIFHQLLMEQSRFYNRQHLFNRWHNELTVSKPPTHTQSL